MKDSCRYCRTSADIIGLPQIFMLLGLHFDKKKFLKRELLYNMSKKNYYRSVRLQVCSKFWTILNNLIYIEQFSLSILVYLVYLNLSWSVSNYLGSSRFTYFYLLWSILGYIELSKAISDKNWIYRALSGYYGLFWAI